MAFIITKDYIENYGTAEEGTAVEVSVVGPRDISPEAETMLKAGKGTAFAMYDDDGELYYRGRYIEDPNFVEDFWSEENELQPLDCYGTPNAGCTEIRMYNKKTKKWDSI